MKRMAGEGAFTMVELLVVIIIIAILAAVAIPLYLGQRDKAKDASVSAGVHAIHVGIQTYAIDSNDTYPLEADVAAGGGVGAGIGMWPQDPYNGGDMLDGGDQPGDFEYTVDADQKDYSLTAYVSSGDLVVH